jgi:hypothetical protein
MGTVCNTCASAQSHASIVRMTTHWPPAIGGRGLGLNITVMSYAGAMGFGFITALRRCRHPGAVGGAARGAGRTRCRLGALRPPSAL